MQEAASIESQGSTGPILPWATISRFFATASRRATVVLGFTIPISTTVTEAVLGFLIVCWLLSGDYTVRLQMIRRNRVALLALAMFAIFAVAAVYSSAPPAEAMRTLFTYRKFLYIPVLITVFAHPEARKYGIYAFLLAMLITLATSFLMLWGFLESPNASPAAHEAYYHGSTKELPTDCAFFKNHIAQNVLMPLFVVVLVSRGCPRSRLRWLYLGLIILLILLAVYNIFFMVAGRTGYVVVFALVLLWMYRAKGLRGLVVAVVLLACLGPFLYLCSPPSPAAVSEDQPPAVSQLRNRIDVGVRYAINYCCSGENPDGSRMGGRLLFYETALRVASQSPLVGTGTGSLRTEFQRIPKNRGLKPTADAHNEYLNVLVQTGLIGLCVFLWWIRVQWNYSTRLSPEWASLAQGTIVVMVAASFFNSIVSSTTEGWTYCYFISLCCGSLLRAPPAAQLRRGGSRFARWMGIAVLFCIFTVW